MTPPYFTNLFLRHLCRCLTPKPTQMSRPWRHSLWLNASAWAIPLENADTFRKQASGTGFSCTTGI